MARRDKNLGRIPDPISPQLTIARTRESPRGSSKSRFEHFPTAESHEFNNLDYSCTRPKYGFADYEIYGIIILDIRCL